MGPGTGTALYAAKIADIEPIVYFVHYQLPVAIPMILVIAILNIFVQRYFDRRNDDVYEESIFASDKVLKVGPPTYAILPVLPIALLCIFSKFGYSAIQLNTVTALLLSWVIGVIVELIRVRNVKQVFQDAMAMIKGMGSLFSTIVALIIAAEVFATGIKLCGLITLLLDGANAGGLGITGMSAVLSGLIAVVSFLTGSGVGALTSLGSIATDVANGLGGNVTQLIYAVYCWSCKRYFSSGRRNNRCCRCCRCESNSHRASYRYSDGRCLDSNDDWKLFTLKLNKSAWLLIIFNWGI